jgi:signal transduction histidine kinase
MFHICSNARPESMTGCDHKDESAENAAVQAIAHEVLRSMITAQERELSNIARELHDDVCQRLAILSLKIERVAKAWANGQAQVGEQLQQIWRQCSTLTGDVQALSHELHPSLLDNLGLVTAAKSICREVSERSGAAVDFTDTDVPTALPREVSLCLFRVIQEALHNSVKYSGGNQFHVLLQGEPGEIVLEVRDRGVGFNTATLKNKAGLGLVSMRERVQLLNGTIQIDSKPNGGTRIRACVPFVEDSRTTTLVAN